MKTISALWILTASLYGATALAAEGFEYEEKFTNVADGWDMIFPGGGSGPLVATQCGTILHFTMDGTRTELGNLSSQVECQQLEAGVTGIAVDRGLGDSGYLYVYYTVKGQITSAVARVTITRSGESFTLDTGSFDPIIEGLPFATNGARNSGGLAVDANGTHLFVATGDNNSINQAKLAQDVTAFHGKLLRFRTDGSVPSDNPTFGAVEGALKSIYAIGFGRPYRIGFDPENGNVFVADSARLSWSEVSVVPTGGGGNYGWPQVEGNGHTGPGGVDPIDSPIAPVWETTAPAPGSLLIMGQPYRRPEGATGGLPEPLHGYAPVVEFYETWLKLIGPNGELVETDPGLSGPRAIATGPDGELWVLEAQKNAISRLRWADEAPTVTMDAPTDAVRYNGDETIELSASGNDPEDGDQVSGFEWTLTLYNGAGDVVDTAEVSGATGSYTLPTEVDIEGRLEVRVEGRDTIGNVGVAERTIFPDASRVTFNTDPADIPFEIDGEAITEEIIRVYEPNTPLVVECPPEYTFEDDPDQILYVFLSRSDDKGADETFVVPSEDFTLTCQYRRFDEPVVADDGTVAEPVIVDFGSNEPTGEAPSDDGCTTTPGTPSSPWSAALLVLALAAVIRRRRVA